jgi:hypothetical protein
MTLLGPHADLLLNARLFYLNNSFHEPNTGFYYFYVSLNFPHARLCYFSIASAPLVTTT